MKWDVPYVIVIYVRKENGVIDSVRGAGKVDKDTHGIQFIIEGICSVVNQIDESHISGLLRSEAMLLVEKHVEARKELRKMIADRR